MKTIDIYSKETSRASHFRIEGQQLVVSGNLPHAYRFEPRTILDAETLIDWLIEWSESRKKEIKQNAN